MTKMKNSMPRYTFYKHKYGSELLVDVVELKYVKKFLAKSAVHTLNYYDITFITEGKGAFSVISISVNIKYGRRLSAQKIICMNDREVCFPLFFFLPFQCVLSHRCF